jgi:hypothetical protein
MGARGTDLAVISPGMSGAARADMTIVRRFREALSLAVLVAAFAACSFEPDTSDEVASSAESESPLTLAPLPLQSYWAYPFITRSQIKNPHESMTPNAFMYFKMIGYRDAKDGYIPYALGLVFDGVTRPVMFEDDVYATNFQGPRVVQSQRTQYEFRSSCKNQYSTRRYPMPKHVQGVASPSVFTPTAQINVAEHDEGFSYDDKVGGFTLDRRWCNVDVFSRGARYGFTNEHAAQVGCYDGRCDITAVSYRLWCYRCEGTANCKLGVAPTLAPMVIVNPANATTDSGGCL